MYLAYRYIDGDVLETRAQGSSGTPSCLRFASLLLLAIVPLFFLGGLRRSLLPSGQALAEPFGSSRAEAINMPFHLLCLGLGQSLLLLGVFLTARRQHSSTALRDESAGEPRDSILPSFASLLLLTLVALFFLGGLSRSLPPRTSDRGALQQLARRG